MIKKIIEFYYRMVELYLGIKNKPKQRKIVSIICGVYCISMLIYIFTCFSLNDDRGNYEMVAALIFYAALFTLAYLQKKPKKREEVITKKEEQ